MWRNHHVPQAEHPSMIMEGNVAAAGWFAGMCSRWKLNLLNSHASAKPSPLGEDWVRRFSAFNVFFIIFAHAKH